MKVVDINNKRDGQFVYLDRWVNKAYFRTFVYNDKGEQKLANSYEEYESLTQSGVWFASKPDIEAYSRKRKQKDGISSTDSQ